MTERDIFKEYFKKWVVYLTLLCVALSSQQPFKLNGQGCCRMLEEDESQRTRTATIVAGASVIALVGGIACLTCCSSSHHKKHSHSSSDSNAYYPSSRYDSYGQSHDSYGWHHHDSYGSHQSHHSKKSSHSSSHHSSHSVGGVPRGLHGDPDPQFLQRGADDGNLPAHTPRVARSKQSKEADQMTGVFVSHPSLSTTGKGKLTAFVQMPDGTTQVLGTLPFSGTAGSSLSYGPFTQKGNYVFRVSVEEGAVLPSHTKVGSVEVHVNGATVESRDFFAPAQGAGRYEPTPCECRL